MLVSDMVREQMKSIGMSVTVTDDEINRAMRTINECMIRTGMDTLQSKLEGMVGTCALVLSAPVYWYIFQIPDLKKTLQDQISDMMSSCRSCHPSSSMYYLATQVVELGPRVLTYLSSPIQHLKRRLEDQPTSEAKITSTSDHHTSSGSSQV